MKEKQIMKKGDKVVCIKHDVGITINKEYTVVSYDATGYTKPVIRVCADHGSIGTFFADYFEIVPTELSMEEQVKLAKSYLGKNIITESGTKFKVAEITVLIDEKNISKFSFTVTKYFHKHGYAVVLKGDPHSCPVTTARLAPSEVSVKLNDNYDAKVTKDTIQVGCQTFSISIIDDLLKAKNSL